MRTPAALDCIYIVRTSLPADELGAAAVAAYKGLSVVERAFRSYKTVDLKVRPVYHYADRRVRADVLLCMLAYYVEWHMRQRLKPLLFDDHEADSAKAARGREGAGRCRRKAGCVGPGLSRASPAASNAITVGTGSGMWRTRAWKPSSTG